MVNDQPVAISDDVPIISYNIIVDTKEPKKMHERVAAHPELWPDFQDIAKYSAGDYIVAGWLWERKTCGDFVASIKDKRIWKQVESLKGYQTRENLIHDHIETVTSKHGWGTELQLNGDLINLKPGFIVEGNWYYALKNSKFTYNQIFGVYNSIIVDWGIPIIRTASQKETVKYFAKLARKAVDGPTGDLHAIRAKGLKKKSLSYRQRYMLEGIMGIGPAKATELLIAGKRLGWVLENLLLYPSLQYVYHLIDTEKIIGKKVAESIAVLMQHDFDESEV